MKVTKDEPERETTIVPRTMPEPVKQPERKRPANDPAPVVAPERERKRAA